MSKEKQLKLIRNQYHLLGQKEAIAARWKKIEEEAEARLRGRVRASQLMHPGTRVTIGRSLLHLKDELVHSSLMLGSEHTVVVGPYE